jgi:glycosyltransferase involved in cell wall biosynthesis
LQKQRVKFSVLIPTRNRLDYLRYAVDSVRGQNYEDWEIVVADNESEQDVGEYLRTLDDERIRYFRTTRSLPVTENWNFALEQSRGDYVVMLGDDDALLRNYFCMQSELVDRYEAPEFVYCDALQYAYPNVIPDHPEPFLQIGYTRFFEGVRQPFLLPRQSALDAVADSMRFRSSFGFNMQHYLVSRQLITRLAGAGPFFQSPYPDYYAANVLMLTARRALVIPRPMVVIGISKASFGYFYFNRRQAEGDQFLNNALTDDLIRELRDVLLPGSSLNTSWLAAMTMLKRNYPREATFPVSHRRYRFLQIVATWRAGGARALLQIWRQLSWRERLTVGALGLVFGLLQLLPGALRRAAYRALTNRWSAYPSFDLRRKTVPYRSIREVFKNVAPEYY